MRIVKSVILGAALLACIPGVAQAQDRRFHFNVGFGPTFITKDLGDRFSTGFGPSAGVTFDVTNRIGVQAEYSFNRFHAENYVDLLGGHFTASSSVKQPLAERCSADRCPGTPSSAHKSRASERM